MSGHSIKFSDVEYHRVANIMLNNKTKIRKRQAGGLQEDMNSGTIGSKEGLSSIGRSGLTSQGCYQLSFFVNNIS